MSPQAASNWDPHMVALAEQAADHLQGTCMSLGNLGEEFEAAENDTTFCDRLDELVFCCVRCDWWFEQSQMSELAIHEWFCHECEGE